ncbi:hypothetical protein H0H93_011013 [Arthromyces matolae]|nr:hypothetical protein H0H93_011013 [Arthromyces matolae]
MTADPPKPCVACVSAATTLLDLSASLRAAKEALSAAEKCMQSITVPLPNDIAIQLGYHPVDLAGVPEPFRKYCQKNDLHILQAQPSIIHARAIDHYNRLTSFNVDRTTPAVVPEANNPVMDWDARVFNSTLPRTMEARTVVRDDDIDSPSSVVSSVSSVSTDWEREYSIDPSTMIDGPGPNPTSAGIANTSDVPVHSSADHVPPEERWYVVYAGREPGVVQGHQNRLRNIEGMAKNDSHRVSSEALGWKLFLQGLEDGRVLQLQPVQDAKRLTIADFN